MKFEGYDQGHEAMNRRIQHWLAIDWSDRSLNKLDQKSHEHSYRAAVNQYKIMNTEPIH